MWPRCPILILSIALCAAADTGPQLIAKRCLGCHNDQSKVAGLDLTTRAGAERVLARMSSRVGEGSMPPTGKLAAEEITVIQEWIAEGAQYPGKLQPPYRKADTNWWSLQPLKQTDATSIDQLVDRKLAEKHLSPAETADRRTLIRRATYDLIGLPPTPEEVESFVADSRPDAYAQLIDRLLASPHYGERWGRHWLDVARFGESHGYEQNHLRPNAYHYRDWVIRAFNSDKPFDRMILEQLAGDQIAPDDPDVMPATGFLVAGVHDTVGNQAVEAAALQRASDLDDIVTAVGSGFLGLTINCARCHDHKFDPIRQADYYQLSSVFNGVQHKERPLAPRDEVARAKQAELLVKQDKEATEKAFAALRDGAKERLQQTEPAIRARLRPPVDMRGTDESFSAQKLSAIRMRIANTAGEGAPAMDELEVWTASPKPVNVALAANGASVTASSERVSGEGKHHYQAANLIDGRYGQSWIADENKTATVTVHFSRPQTVNRIHWSRDGGGGNLSATGGTPIEYIFEGSSDGQHWEHLLDSTGRLPFEEKTRERFLLFQVFNDQEKARWTALEAHKFPTAPALPMAYIGDFEQPQAPSYINLGGNPMNKGDIVYPATPSTLAKLLPVKSVSDEAPEGERRLMLANWLVDPANVLTARVLANRLWQYHFGSGIVGTPSDFGLNGEQPTNQDLLDYLATRVYANKWSIKAMHREIMLSRAYQRASTWNEGNAKVDSESRYLWRFPPQRLEAEAIRDAILSVAGTLDEKMYGPGFQLYKYTVDNVATYLARETFGPETFRRTVYHQAPRSIRIELLSTYDCPDSAMPEPKRAVTTTALQALDLLNNSFLVEQAKFFAQRLEKEAPADSAAQVDRAFNLAFGRAPNDMERTAALDLIAKHGIAIFCRALLNANEFVYVM